MDAANSAAANLPITQRQRYLQRLVLLKNARASWDVKWKDIANYIQPTRSRFTQTEANKGDSKFTYIINGTPTYSADVLAAGMMAGLTSPARNWFRFTIEEDPVIPDLDEADGVKAFCASLEEKVRRMFQASNVYEGLAAVYSDIGSFSTTALHVEEDELTLLRCYSFPVGQFYLATNGRGAVDTCFRELTMTVEQLVGKFTLEKCSTMVQNLHRSGQLDQQIQVVHVIEPNAAYVKGAFGPRGKKFKSCWFESGGIAASGTSYVATSGGEAATGLLREAGYSYFPVLAPRWSTTGEDSYGSGGPGDKAIGDSKALQLLEKRKLQAVDKIVDPPMVGPAALEHQESGLQPGDRTYVDVMQGGQTFAPAITINPAAIAAIREEIGDHSQRIKRAFFADLWLMLSESDQTMTAREVSERHEEKMLQLGPVMERVHAELLIPLIEMAVAILTVRRLLPKVPKVLQGRKLRIEFISIMAQAQKLLGTTAIERLAGFIGNLAAGHQEALDMINWDALVKAYAEMLGVPPDVINTEELVAQIRQGRAQAQAQQAQMAQTQQAADAAQTLSQADTDKPNALTALLGHLGPPGGAQGVA